MIEKVVVEELYSDATLNLVFDTLKQNKQVLVFVNTKRGAESVAEKIAEKIKNVELKEMSEKALKAMNRPTKQCERLAYCLKRGVAFHHAGLVSEQRKLVEDNFRGGAVKVICATPTLAYGLNLPAFRAIIRDLTRYGGNWGVDPIPVLEYHQMAGRAGRPGREDFGEAVCVAKNPANKENIIQNYIFGESEEIFSKLAVEPVLRTYVLSLIASGYVKDTEGLFDFFSKTFWAHQYEDMKQLKRIIEKMLGLLEEWEFLKPTNNDPFVSSNELANQKLEPTIIGRRVAELYIDPLTANFMINCLRRAEHLKLPDEFAYIHMICSTLEMRPIFKPGTKEYAFVEERVALVEDDLLYPAPSMYDAEYEDFLATIKTAIVLEEWINESEEYELLETYNVRPGEFRAKLEDSDWLLYATDEFASLIGFHKLRSTIKKTRLRLKHGVKEELVPLVRLRNIGRVRARLLFRNGVRNVGDIAKMDVTKLKQLLGPKIGEDLKSLAGQETEQEVSPTKRKGQMGLGKYE